MQFYINRERIEAINPYDIPWGFCRTEERGRHRVASTLQVGTCKITNVTIVTT